MTRLTTLLGYAAIAVAIIVVEAAARRSRRMATFGQAMDLVLGVRLVRLLLLASWLWLGWHLFVRVHWR